MYLYLVVKNSWKIFLRVPSKNLLLQYSGGGLDGLTGKAMLPRAEISSPEKIILASSSSSSMKINKIFIYFF